jgi:ubiquinone/menaquinone biosynthesis C-methylase UbiE
MRNAWPEPALFPDFVAESMSDVLDCGFGTASWCTELGEFNPDCSITGVDIALQMVEDWAENVDLQIADLNEKLDFGAESFDFVHSRMVAGGVSRLRWPGYLSDISRILRQNGWLQVMEWDMIFRSNNQRSDKIIALQQWAELYHQALDASRLATGRKLARVTQIEDFMRAARFRDVSTQLIEVPTCGWHHGECSQR